MSPPPTPHPSPARDPLAPPRQFVVRLTTGTTEYLRRPERRMVDGTWDNFARYAPTLERAARFASAGEAASVATTHPYELPAEAYEIEVYSPPAEPDSREASARQEPVNGQAVGGNGG